MNKFILSLPKPILKSYVLKHFSELTIDDYFEIIDKIDIPSYYYLKNKVLNSSSKVLEIALDRDAAAFDFFDIDAFNNACIEKIARINHDLSPNQIQNFSILLTNEDICKRVLKSYPFLIKKVDPEMVNDEIIEILENTYYEPDREDFYRIEKLLESEKLRKKAVLKDPSLIIDIPLTEAIVSEAVKQKYVPNKKYFYENPSLKQYHQLLELALKEDPSMIVFFNKQHLTLELALFAVKNGFVATEEDLIYNPDLCTSIYIMDKAIKNNPSLIRYIKKDCYLKFEDIAEATKYYKITKEDLEKNPDLCLFAGVMINYPEYRLYSKYLTEEEKLEEIIKYLRNKENLTKEKLPFLDYKFGGTSNCDKLNILAHKLNIEIDEGKVTEQKKYYNILDNLIEGMVNVRYESEKSSFQYSNIVALNDDIVKYFRLIKETNNNDLLEELINNIYEFCGLLLDKEYISKELNEFYNIFVENETIDLSVTSDFCNKVLNEHRNSFMGSNRQLIVEEVASKLDLTEKKKMTILNSVKLLKVANNIRQNNFDLLGITLEQYNQGLEKLKKEILNNKDIKKLNIENIDSKFSYIINLFNEKGYINDDDIHAVLEIKDKDACKFIINKFERFKMKFTDKVDLTDNELYLLEIEKNKIDGINYNNFVIASNNNVHKNIAKILIKLNDETLNKILDNNYIDEILCLLPLIDFVPDFDVDTFINILSNYDRVRSKIACASKLSASKNLSTQILKKSDDLINLSNAYNSVDDITMFSLGKGVVDELGEQYANRYLDVYIQMINRNSGCIPPVICQNKFYKLESGVYSDCDRLLIGKKPSKDSCIDLMNSAGQSTFNEVLLKNTGDVVLVKNHSNQLLSRIFLIRRGNVVQLITRSAENFDISLLKELADQIIKASIENNDNIDYVVINKNSYMLDNHNYISFKDRRFQDLFGHADIFGAAILLSSKSEKLGYTEEDVNFDFGVEPKCSYLKQRKPISYNPSNGEITHLRALHISMEENEEIRENKSRNFEPFYMEEYSKVVCGEDWYLAEKNDGTIEEVILNTNDDRKYLEISKVKRDIFNLEEKQNKK